MLRDASGQASIEFAGVLAVIVLVFGVLFAAGLAPTVADAAEHAVCTIVGGDCDAGSDPGGGEEPGGEEGPVPVDFDLPFPVLPFPGSASVSCTYSTSSPGACQPGDGPGVSVGTEGTLEIERSDTTLDAEGCPTQTLSVTASLELQTTVSGETPVASGSLTTFLGEATTYSVTVPPDAADAIEHGDRPVPEPGRPAHDPGRRVRRALAGVLRGPRPGGELPRAAARARL